jgi:hypothetical protein
VRKRFLNYYILYSIQLKYKTKMLSKFSKNIAGTYVQQKLTLAALFARSSRTPAFQQAAQLNAMFLGANDQGLKRYHEMRMFSTENSEAVSEPQTARPPRRTPREAEPSFKTVRY